MMWCGKCASTRTILPPALCPCTHAGYHPECLQCSVRALGAQSKWQCPDCAGPADEDVDLT